jgi:hypothetical protein
VVVRRTPNSDNSCAIQRSECPIIIFWIFIKSVFAQIRARLALCNPRLFAQSISVVDRLKPGANLRTSISASLLDTVLRNVLSTVSVDDGEQFEHARPVMIQTRYLLALMEQNCFYFVIHLVSPVIVQNGGDGKCGAAGHS